MQTGKHIIAIISRNKKLSRVYQKIGLREMTAFIGIISRSNVYPS